MTEMTVGLEWLQAHSEDFSVNYKCVVLDGTSFYFGNVARQNVRQYGGWSGSNSGGTAQFRVHTAGCRRHRQRRRQARRVWLLSDPGGASYDKHRDAVAQPGVPEVRTNSADVSNECPLDPVDDRIHVQPETGTTVHEQNALSVNVVNSSESGITHGDDADQLEKPISIQSREQPENVTTTTNCTDSLKPGHTQPCIDATAKGKHCRLLCSYTAPYTPYPRPLASGAVILRNGRYISSIKAQALCAGGIERQTKMTAYAVRPQRVQSKDRPFEMMAIEPDEVTEGYLSHRLIETDMESHQHFTMQQVLRVDDEVFHVTPGNISISVPPYEKCIM